MKTDRSILNIYLNPIDNEHDSIKNSIRRNPTAGMPIKEIQGSVHIISF